MKRLLALMMAALMLLGFTGCMRDIVPTAPAEEPTAAPTADSASEDITLPTESATEAATEPTTEPATEPVTEPATEPPTKPATEPPVKPATEPATEPPMKPATEPPTEPATESPANRYAGFSGSWKSTTQYHTMILSVDNGMLYISYFCYSGNGLRIAMTDVSAAISDIQNNRVTIDYSDDGWGNRGSITLDFSRSDQIGCTTVTSYQTPSAMWSIIPADLTFVRSN